ncbi:sensor histidine kinase [Algoriphagus sp.]|uniref:sensor histidine kinase n=1 Tax=Algoriphagus sp. TaxID=1872435 RepID=UPI0027284DDC|nr:histidine kinase [Algoriphagus sp.]MDO8965327.1 histidine kinase [Algoriphagus sp.]MDP3198759.1 histidine kinase [Algoriphagus sp.]
MFFNAFSNPKLGKWIIPGTGVIWFLGCFLLLMNYEIEGELAFYDSFVFALIFLGGVFVLDRVFSLFAPKGKNIWLLFTVPIILSWIGVMVHGYVLKWWLNDAPYLDFLTNSFYLRWAILALADQLISVLALVVSQLERQEEIQKREAQMLQLSKDAELAQLRQQLQPHFLFNSLNSINALVISQPQKAREMVLQLSDFLRGTIRKDSQQWIPLEEELNYLKMYLDIERVRFGHRLQVDFEVDKEFYQVKLPQLLIQPLVENAIKHGLYGVTGEVKIEVKGKKEGSYFLIEVINPFDIESSVPEGTGFGLSSVERRLFLLFGRTDLLVSGVAGNLFKVRLKIPQYQ